MKLPKTHIPFTVHVKQKEYFSPTTRKEQDHINEISIFTHLSKHILNSFCDHRFTPGTCFDESP